MTKTERLELKSAIKRFQELSTPHALLTLLTEFEEMEAKVRSNNSFIQDTVPEFDMSSEVRQ